MFTNRFLSPSVVKSVMDIQFSRRLTNITFSFATIQVAPIEIETPIELAASLDAAPAGTTNAAGVYGGPTGNDSWPMGTLTFRSRAPFNAVRIRVPTIVPPPNTGQATDFLLDNVTVALAPPPATNVPPVLAPISNQVATAGTPLSFTILASDENVPAQALTFSLDGTCPAGAALTAAGVFNWTPLGAQGPSNYVFTVRVTDDGTPPLSVTTNFMVSVSLPSRPAMKILPTRTNTAAVSWAWPSPGFLLQEKSVPGTNAWASCTNPVTPVGGRCEVIVPRPATNRFYRLCLP